MTQAAIKANKKQKQRLFKKVLKVFDSLINKKIAILGLSFKANTSDIREAPALELIPILIKKGAKIQVYCPCGMPDATQYFSKYANKISYCKDEYQAVENCDVLIMLTEWEQFSKLDLFKIKSKMVQNYLFDFRNVFANNMQVRKLFNYYPVGLG